jgi:CelD/BcsL family acetyltransferase involved in cellulose biosynthesis
VKPDCLYLGEPLGEVAACERLTSDMRDAAEGVSSPSSVVASVIRPERGNTNLAELYIMDPLLDSRWDDLVARHPKASAFHQRGWLEALACTYGYEPRVLTSAPAGKPLSDGIVLCRVSSWITGTRLVSLPFADHCEPLLNDPDDSLGFTSWLRAECDRQQYKYFELRPLSTQAASCSLQPSGSYCFHKLDIRPSLEQIFRALHRSSIQRKIRRAEREQLSYEVGRSEEHLNEFYRLVLITRSRLKVLPQPRNWFRNLIRHMGDKVQISLARKNGTAVAAMLTLRHRSSVIYKYGCSDKKFHNLGGMPFLFWKLIEESKASRAEQIDFGRTDLNNEGLITFKNRFGTTRSVLTYYRHPNPESGESAANWYSPLVRQLCSNLPDAVCSAAGRVLYKHVG